jgi:putative salt-induced outer membrane protein YdiY
MTTIFRRLAPALLLLPLAAAQALADSPPADAPLTAVAPPAKKWHDTAEASYVNTNGNSRTATTAAKDSFSYDFNKATRLELEGGGLGTRSAGQVTAEQYYAREKTQRNFTDRDYVFENYRWDKNRFAGIANLQVVSVGVGRDLWKTKSDLWTFEAAPGYLNEEFTNAPRRSVGTARAYTRYSHDFTPTSKFSQDVEYIQSLADKRDSRVNTETDLTTALSSHFSVKTSFTWKRSNLPPAGVHKDDEITSFALLANF